MLRSRHETEPMYTAVTALAERVGMTDHGLFATVLALQALAGMDVGSDVEHTTALLDRAHAIFRKLGGYHSVGVLVEMVLAMFGREDMRATLNRTQAMAEAEGKYWEVGLILMFRARVAADDDSRLAEDCARRAMEHFRRYGDRWGASESGQVLGYVQSLRGDHREALATFAEAAAMARELDATGDLCLLNLQAAWEHEYLGEPRAAAKLLGAAAAIRPRTLPATRNVSGLRIIGDVRGALAPDEYERAFAEGRALPIDAALALAREQVEHFAAT